MFEITNLAGFKLFYNTLTGESIDSLKPFNFFYSLFSSEVSQKSQSSENEKTLSKRKCQQKIDNKEVKRIAAKTSLMSPSGSLIKKALLFLNMFNSASAVKNTTVNVFFMGDIYKVDSDRKGFGGYAEGRALLNQEIKRTDNALILGLGDLIAPYAFGVDELGSSYADLIDEFFSYSDSKSSHPALKHPYDYTAVGEGNHEYDYSRRVLDRVEARSHFPWLRGANVIDNQDRPIAGQSSRIFKFEDINIGVFALVDEETEKNSWPNRIFPEHPICKEMDYLPDESVYLSCEEDHVRFDSIIVRAKEKVKELKDQNADVIIALVHTKRNAVKKLMEEVPEIHLSLQGHDHAARIDETFHIYNPGTDFKDLGEVTLTISKKEGLEATVFQSGRLIPNQGYIKDSTTGKLVPNPNQPPKDLAIAKKVEKILQKKAAFDAIRIAKMDIRFSTDSKELRSGETLAGNLIADALCKRMKADCSIIVAGSIRGPIELHAGEYFTEGHALEIFPYGDKGTLVEISGQTLLNALENGVSDGWNAGKFLQVSGMSFSYSLNKAAGERINSTEVFIQGKPLDLQKNYKVGAIDYMTIKAQDGYEDLARNSTVLIGQDHDLLMDRIFANHIIEMDSVSVELEDRIICKNQ